MQGAYDVRAAVEAVEMALGRLASAGAEASDGVVPLRASWGRLVELLALGPAPELRSCPHCGSVGMQAATRCGSCWKKLDPGETQARSRAEVA